jgi:hypothetical protein
MKRDNLNANLNRLLVQFAIDSYWYGEETGDYDMEEVNKTNFFLKTLRAIKREYEWISKKKSS